FQISGYFVLSGYPKIRISDEHPYCETRHSEKKCHDTAGPVVCITLIMQDDEQSMVNRLTDIVSSESLEYVICDVQQLKKSRSWSSSSPQNCKSQSLHSIGNALFASSYNSDILRKNLLPFATHQENANSTDFSHNRNATLLDQNLRRNVLSVTGCEMCANYEIKMQQLQDNEKRLRQQLTSNQSVMENFKTELTSEKILRSENERKFADMNVEFSNELQSLRRLLHNVESKFQQNEQLFDEKWQDCQQKFKEATAKSKILKSKMEGVQNRYENLLGKHRTPVDAMTREAIDLPQTVEELHVYCLRLREELIEAKIAKDHLEETLKSELLFAKDQRQYLN
uniref:Rabaptin GTPase-Rab5 binding domain-containing protein n=1 Tax=Romanomermis culicivorax TaxID=13658 RepID=A0A915HUC4_ROMCU